MLPAFIPGLVSYVFSKDIKKNISYGASWRNLLDLYLPSSTTEGKPLYVRLPSKTDVREKAPVVVFISGGAWIIGYKFWAFIMGQLLQQQGILFITPDYRNYPEVNADAMVEDVIRAMNWVFANLATLGGDPNNISLIGQSAGAHISALALLDQIDHEVGRPGGRSSSKGASEAPRKADMSLYGQWSVRSLTRWVGISGPYNMMEVLPKFHERGVPVRVLQTIMNYDLLRYSPSCRVHDLTVAGEQKALQLLPPMYLFHGTSDKTVDWQQSEKFAEVLQKANARVHLKYYKNKSHTDPILEDPVEGTQSELMCDLLQLVMPGAQFTGSNVGRLQPRQLLRLAKIVNPF
jgi:prenylcysteine alpha-carboxyl methylesterase